MTDKVYNFLTQVRHTEHLIRQKLAKKEALENCLEPSAIRYDLDRVQTSPEDQVSKICAEIEELDRDISRLHIQAAEQTEEICDRIDELESDEERTVLLQFYVQRWRMEDIADGLEYSVSGAYKIRRRGASRLDRILKERKRG